MQIFSRCLIGQNFSVFRPSATLVTPFDQIGWGRWSRTLTNWLTASRATVEHYTPVNHFLVGSSRSSSAALCSRAERCILVSSLQARRLRQRLKRFRLRPIMCAAFIYFFLLLKWWAQVDSNHRRPLGREIYSLLQLPLCDTPNVAAFFNEVLPRFFPVLVLISGQKPNAFQ